MILDGTLIRINRNRIDRPFCSCKHKRHGMNLQAIADARGNLLATPCKGRDKPE